MYRKYPLLFFFFFSVYVCIVAWKLDLGALHKPGPGFMPFWSAIFLGVLALMALINDLRTMPAEEGGEKDNVHWKSILFTLIYFLGYILTLEYIGFIIGTTLFVGLVIKSIEKKGWLVTVSFSLSTALVSFYVFRVWLQAELPKGFLGY